MEVSSGLKPRRKKSYYYFWGAVFVAVVLFVGYGLYFATLEVDYVWRWYRVPQYFVFKDKIEVRAEIEGQVTTIAKEEEKTLIKVKGVRQSETYAMDPGEILVARGDSVHPGDVLGFYHEWKAGYVLRGLWTTLKVSVISILFGIFLGLFSGLARLSDNPTLKWGAICYIELIRGSPLLVQIFIWYFVLGKLIDQILAQMALPQVPAFYYGAIALTVFSGAYIAEIVRAGIQSVHIGQTEAARSLGMTSAKAMRHVILPQAFRRILPPLAGQFISLIKDSSLLGVIAIVELAKATREVVSTSLQPFELWTVCALLYLSLTFSLSMLVQYLEKRTVQR
ncbi:MAG: amino acid ABC transporter permease [Desulfarculaceae bacterium]|jgi:polar amino acid transport system permease protein